MHRCINPYCPSRGLEGLRHFVSRGAMDIDGVGEKLMARFWELGLVRRAPDLYALTAEQLTELEGFQQRSAENVIASIARSRERPFGRVLFALGIPHVGGVTAEAIAQHFRSLAALRAAGPDEIAEVEGVGPVVAESLAAWLAFPANAAVLDDLVAAGLSLELTGDAPPPGEGPLAGLTFVITGTLASSSRDEAKASVIARGRQGHRLGLEADELRRRRLESRARSSRRPRDLGVPVLDDEAFRRLLEERPSGRLALREQRDDRVLGAVGVPVAQAGHVDQHGEGEAAPARPGDVAGERGDVVERAALAEHAAAQRGQAVRERAVRAGDAQRVRERLGDGRDRRAPAASRRASALAVVRLACERPEPSARCTSVASSPSIGAVDVAGHAHAALGRAAAARVGADRLCHHLGGEVVAVAIHELHDAPERGAIACCARTSAPLGARPPATKRTPTCTPAAASARRRARAAACAGLLTSRPPALTSRSRARPESGGDSTPM